MSFVDYSPAVNRVEGVNGVIKKSKLVILHDSEEMRYIARPKDFDHNMKFSTWNEAKVTILYIRMESTLSGKIVKMSRSKMLST